MKVRLPVSDSLNLLNREQLLKFAQYLLCEHKNEPVVESAQNLLDKLLVHGGPSKGDDDINTIAGAPDPTAGPGKFPMDSPYGGCLLWNAFWGGGGGGGGEEYCTCISVGDQYTSVVETASCSKSAWQISTKYNKYIVISRHDKFLECLELLV